MDVTINIDQAVLADCGISSEHFREAAENALSHLNHPETGDSIYFNSMRITVIENTARLATGEGKAAEDQSTTQPKMLDAADERPLLSVFDCILPGVLIVFAFLGAIAAGIAVFFGCFAVINSSSHRDHAGVVNGIYWIVVFFVLAAVAGKIYESLRKWFERHNVPPSLKFFFK